MSLESLTNRGEYLSAHFLAEVLPAEIKKGQLARWAAAEEKGGHTPRDGIRNLRRVYFDVKAELADLAADETSKRRDKLHELHAAILTSLGFTAERTELSVERAGKTYVIPVAYAGSGVAAVECGWAVDSDAALDPDDAGLLLDAVELDARERIDSGVRLASFLHALDDAPPRYVLILSGAVVTLADRTSWGEGRYLSVSLDAAFARNDARPAGELDVIAALFSADALQPPAEGGAEALAELVAASRQHAVGVSSELRGGLRQSVELIANEVLDRIREAGYRPEQIMEPAGLADRLGREALRYLYRILFLLYAEARPELGVLPVDDRDYIEGYSLARLGDLIARQLVGEESRRGFHLFDSLNLLFRMVNEGHPTGGGLAPVHETTSDSAGIRFEPLKSDLFRPEAITLIGAIPPPDDIDNPDAASVDTRLRNATLHRVLRLLMLTTGKKKQRGGFISYAQLGINQLGAVYEGLMSYSGFIAAEELFEVAKGGDPKDGSWMVPASKADNYPDDVFVTSEDSETGARDRVRHPAGSFVYRLAGRDRQTSASYYTPQTLTATTVQLALTSWCTVAGV